MLSGRLTRGLRQPHDLSSRSSALSRGAGARARSLVHGPQSIATGPLHNGFPGLPAPALYLDFLRNYGYAKPGIVGRATDLITSTRNSAAWNIGPSGLYEQIPANTPRLAYGAGQVPLGLLCEGERRNVCLQNRDFTQAIWTKVNMTVARDQVGIMGVANTASRATATAANATVLQSLTSAVADRAVQFFVRRITGTGTVELTVNNGTNWVSVTPPTGSFGRFTFVQNATNPVFGIRLGTSGDEVAVDFIGVENGSFVLSPIETGAATVDRLTDSNRIPAIVFDRIINPREGTFFCEYFPLFTGGVTKRALEMGVSGSTANRLLIGRFSGGSSLSQFISANVSLASLAVTLPDNIVARHVFSYGPNYFRGAANGISAAVDNIGAEFAARPNALAIGCDLLNSIATTLDGYVRRIAYWPTPLHGAVPSFSCGVP